MNKIENTLLLIKPDSVEDKNVGRIIDIIEKKNIKIVYLNMLNLDKKTAKNFYYEHSEKNFYDELVDFITSGPVVFLILEDIDVINKIRLIIGHTDFKKAEDGTIRKLFGKSLTKNAVHASDSFSSFEREKNILFNFIKNAKF